MSTIEENRQLNDETMANDVVPSQHTAMATDESTHNEYYKELIGVSGAGSVSSLSLNDTAIRTSATMPIDTATVTTSNTDSTEEEKMIPKFANKFGAIDLQSNQTTNVQTNKANNNNNSRNNNNINVNMKAKRRRRKSSKQKTNSKPYKKSNWNFQKRNRNSLSRLVPYNTNQFLMEEHMSEINADGGRCRDSSFSFDSDNDKEEYFSKEFCNVYESARSDRLYEMSKSQLIQEYLQLEANYDKLSNSLGKLNGQLENGCTSNNVLKRLADRVQELTTENLELRRQMADIRNRDSRHNGATHHKSSHHSHKSVIVNQIPLVTLTSSEDSESDSSSSTSSSSSSSSDNNSDSDSSNRSRSMILSPSTTDQS